MRSIEDEPKCLETLERLALRGFYVFDTLKWTFHYNRIPYHPDDDVKPTPDELFLMHRQLMNKLKNSADGQTSAFRSDVANKYFSKEIALPVEIRFVNGRVGRADLSTKRMIVYDLIIPFNNANHQNENCVAAKDLPLFYKIKGQEPY